jgi:hypothetical protein
MVQWYHTSEGSSLPRQTKRINSLMIYLLLLSALSLSGIAAWYAIAGLIAIFAALPVPIMIMGGALEVSKLVVASWLYSNFKQIPVLMRTYFTIALIVLMMLTSMGIFGYLSKAHLDQTMSTGDNTLQIELFDNKIARQQQRIADSETVLKQLDGAVQALVDYDRIRGKDGAIAVRDSQKEEREKLTAVIDDASNMIAKYQQEKLVLSKEQLQLEAEVGPIKYIAALIYGEEESKSMLEEAVRIVILMIVFVFDPLAVLMVMAASRELSGRRKVTPKVTKPDPEPEKPVDIRKVDPSPTHYEINVKDDIEFSDSIDEEQSKGMRKAGRYLSEIDAQKSSRASAFANKMSNISDEIEDDEPPFVISSKD